MLALVYVHDWRFSPFTGDAEIAWEQDEGVATRWARMPACLPQGSLKDALCCRFASASDFDPSAFFGLFHADWLMPHFLSHQAQHVTRFLIQH